MGHRSSVRIHYDQLVEVCFTANLFLLMSISDLVCLAMRSVPALSDCSVDHTQVSVLEAMLETSNMRIGALELRISSNHVRIVAKVTLVDSLEGCLRIAEERA